MNREIATYYLVNSCDQFVAKSDSILKLHAMATDRFATTGAQSRILTRADYFKLKGFTDTKEEIAAILRLVA